MSRRVSSVTPSNPLQNSCTPTSARPSPYVETCRDDQGLRQIAAAPAKVPDRRHGRRRARASVGSAVATRAKSEQVRQCTSVKYDAARSISSPSEVYQFVGAAPKHRGRTGRGIPVEGHGACGRCQDLGSTLRYDGVRWPKTQRKDQCIRALVETRTENGLGNKIC